MQKFAAVAMIPLFAGFLCAQDQQTTRTETHSSTTKTTWNGTLIDAACQSSHSEHHESSSASSSEGGVTTHKTESSHSETNRDADCPVTTTTTIFGLMTPDGRYMRFDQPSNTRIVEVVKSNKTWSKDLSERAPIKVSVVGATNGDVVVMESMAPVTTVGQSSRVVTSGPVETTIATETMLDATYNGDNGKLIIGPDSVSWQDLAHAGRSRTWSYAQIKELKRDKDDNAVKISPYSGGEHKFKIRGPLLNDAVYNMIAERIIAARPH
jgi:hypothetical protein